MVGDKTNPVNTFGKFSHRKFTAALQHLKPGNASVPNSICLELIIHAGVALKSWLRDFLSSSLRRLKIFKIWSRALIVAIPKPMKPVRDPKSYLSLSLLSVSYNKLERFIYTCVERIIDPMFRKKQAGFQWKKSIMDQVVMPTQNIHDSFELRRRCRICHLTATYNTVWHRGLTFKLLRLLSDKI